jgi:hypothetical protein
MASKAWLIWLGLKNHFKTWRALLLWALLPPLMTAAIGVSAGFAVEGRLLSDRLAVIFCDLEGSPYFDLFMNMALADESVSKTVEIRKLGYGEAIGELKAGSADAAVIFPETFIRDMMDGINQPVTLVCRDADSMDSVLIREYVTSAANEISATQGAINTVWHFRNLSAPADAASAYGSFADLVIKYAMKAFSRKDLYSYSSVSGGFGADPLAFYASSFVAAFIFLGAAFGVRNIALCRDRLIPDRLASAGLSPAAVAFCNYAPLLFSAFLGAASAVLSVFAVYASRGAVLGVGAAPPAGGPAGMAGSAGGASGFGLDALVGGAGGGAGGGVTAAALLLCLASVFCLCLFASALSLFLSQLFRSHYAACFFVVTAGIAMAVAGGTVIPYPYLPDIFQTLGRYSYSFWAQRMIAGALFEGRAAAAPAAAFALLAGLLFAASALLLGRRTARGDIGGGSMRNSGDASEAGGGADNGGGARGIGFKRRGAIFAHSGPAAALRPTRKPAARPSGAQSRLALPALFALRIKSLLRFRLNFAMLVLTPILAGCCAWAMTNFYFEGGKSLPVGVLDFDGSEFSRIVTERFGQNASIDARALPPDAADALRNAETLVGNGALEAVIVINEGFSEKLRRSAPDGLLQIVCAPTGMTRGFIAELFIAQVSRVYLSCEAAAEAVRESMAGSENTALPPQERERLFDEALAYADAFWHPEPLMTVTYKSLADEEYAAPAALAGNAGNAGPVGAAAVQAEYAEYAGSAGAGAGNVKNAVPAGNPENARPAGNAANAEPASSAGIAAEPAENAGPAAASSPETLLDMLNAMIVRVLSVIFFIYLAFCLMNSSGAVAAERDSGVLMRLKSSRAGLWRWLAVSAAAPFLLYGIPGVALILPLFGKTQFAFASAAFLCYSALGTLLACKARTDAQHQLAVIAALAAGAAIYASM